MLNIKEDLLQKIPEARESKNNESSTGIQNNGRDWKEIKAK